MLNGLEIRVQLYVIFLVLDVGMLPFMTREVGPQG